MSFIFEGLISLLLFNLILLSSDIEINPGPNAVCKSLERCNVLNENLRLIHLFCRSIANKQHKFKNLVSDIGKFCKTV